ncbi:MAG TPA: molybdopterin-dependent oxidoreductase [Chloroflexota bacterium]|nr:molybdopterin-dependent oxidoreductase [Chloroflexota bacterium]
MTEVVSGSGDGRGGLSRRQFLTLAGAGVGAVMFTGCQPPPREMEAQSRVLLAEDLLSAYENWYATACRGCAAACGSIVRVVDGRARKVEGTPGHPVNQGKLCVRGQVAVQEQYHPDRVKTPLVRQGARGAGFAPISWDEALDQLAGQLRGVVGGSAGRLALLTRPLSGHGALVVDRFARAAGAQWLTLDLFGEAPLRQAVSDLLGLPRLPYFDLANAQYVLSFGANFLDTWLSPVQYGGQYGRFRQGDYSVEAFAPRQGRPRGYLVHAEPRFSGTAANADEWLPVRPGSEGVLALSIAQVILSEGLARGSAAGLSAGALAAYAPERVADAIGLSADRIRAVARAFATRQPSLALGGGLAGAHTNGTASLRAILALNLLVGAAGRTGGILPNPAPPLPDVPASTPPSRLADWQAFVARLQSGQPPVVLVAGANPVYGLPATLGFRDALLRAPFVVSFSSFLDETTLLADLVLPTHLPLEDWGSAVPDPAPGYAVLTVQQPVVAPLYDTRGFADVLLALAAELGGPVQAALPWPNLQALLREAALALQGQGGGNVQAQDPERFWTQLLQQGGWWTTTPPTATGGGGAGNASALATGLGAAQFAGADGEYPYHLVVFPHNTLGDGEGAHLPWLQATPDPTTTVTWQTWVEVNPRLAERLGLAEGDVVAIESPNGRVEVPVYVHPAAPPDVLALPLGQGHTAYGRWARGRGVNPLDLLAPLADEATGALAYGATRVRLTKTGRHVAVPKFEGTMPARQLDDRPVVKVTQEA